MEFDCVCPNSFTLVAGSGSPSTSTGGREEQVEAGKADVGAVVEGVRENVGEGLKNGGSPKSKIQGSTSRARGRRGGRR